MLWAAPDADGGQSQTMPANIEGNLAAFCLAPDSSRTGQVSILAESPRRAPFLIDSADRPLVYIWVRRNPAAVAASLAATGVKIQQWSERYRVIEAWLEAAEVPEIAVLPDVLSVTPVYSPIFHAGIAMTQGDALLHADDARDPAQFPPTGFDGTGIKVGVLSDSIGKLQQSVDTGDLPAGVDVLMDADGTDEGRALLEIIHDLAPGAPLAFHTAYNGELDFAQGIRDLAQAGARVIVDDVSYVTEPFFQDGIVGDAVEEVVRQYGVTYVTAAGNGHGKFHSAPFRDAGNGWHDFDPSDAVDTRLHVTVPAGDRAIIILQWSDPWYTADGVTNDFDLYAYAPDGSLADSQKTDNLSTQTPYELMIWGGHPYVQTTYDIAIRCVARGTGQVDLKLWAKYNVSFDEYADGSSVVGHAMAEGAITVGAVPFYNPATAEPTSSRGPALVCYDPEGRPLSTAEIRNKPDVVAPDNVNTSLFGTDIAEDEDDLPNASGTSFAAPHVAAVAAQVLSAEPNLSPAQVRSILRSTAKDLGPAGWDNASGYGMVDALAAVREALNASDAVGLQATLLSPPARTARPIGSASIQFNDVLQAATALAAAGYDLRSDGIDGAFGTADDVVCAVSPTYDAVVHRVQLTFADKLPVGRYQLTVLPSIIDLTGNSLNEGAAQVFAFERTFVGEPFAVGGANQYVAVAPTGEAIFAFRQDYPELRFSCVMGTILDASGAQVAMPFAVNAGLDLTATSVACDPTGHFIVGYEDQWTAYGQDAYIAKLDLTGRREWLTLVRPPWQLDFPTGLTVDASGNVYVAVLDRAWPGEYYVFVRKFDAKGQPVTDMMRVDDPTTKHDCSTASIAADPSGNFVITWVQSRTKVMARLFNADCNALGEPFLVAEGCRGAPSYVSRSDQFFIIVWSTQPLFEGWRTFFRIYDNSGVALSDAIRVDSPGLFKDAEMPQVAINPAGGIVVTYIGSDSQTNRHLMLRRFDSSGQALGKEFEVPDGPIGPSSGFTLGVDGEGNVLVAWDGWARWLMNPTPGMADLGIEGITAPEQITPGVAQEVSATFRYWGVPLPEVGVRYTLSADSLLGNEDDRPLIDLRVPAVYDGSRVADRRELVLPADLAPGTWWLFAQVDPNEQVAELDEMNNSVSTSIQVSAPPEVLDQESVANTYRTGDQTTPAVAMAPDGRYVVVWSGQGPDSNPFGSSVGVFGQRYDALGHPLGPQFHASRTSDPSRGDRQVDPAIAVSNSGGFAVVWGDSRRQGNSPVWDVCGRLYDSSGQPMGGEFLLNSDATEGDQTMPAIGIDAAGKIVAVWLDSRGYIYRRWFDATGVARSPSARLDQSSGATKAARPQVVMVPDGRSVVVWGMGSAVPGYFAQWFGPDDSPQGDRIAIPGPAVAVDSQGRLAVAYWGSSADTGADVYVGFFDADGTASGDPVRINTYGSSGQHHPSIAFDGDGQGVVVWVSDLQGGKARVMGRRLDASGRLAGGEFYVSESTSGPPAVAMGGSGHFAVVWQFLGTGWDIASRSFAFPPVWH